MFREFDLVAHVKIIEKSKLSIDTTEIHCNFQITIEVIEFLIKNESKIISVSTHLNSPLANIQTNEEWIIYAKLIDGKLIISPESYWYRKTNGLKNWKDPLFTDPIIELRRFYWDNFDMTFPSQIATKYSNGKPELNENYLNNELEGKRKIYFPNGKLLFEGNYYNGNPNGDLKVYYPNGQLKSHCQYLNGTIYKNSVEYSDTSDFANSKSSKNTYSQNNIKTEKFYDSTGFLVLLRDYDRFMNPLTELLYNSSGDVEKRINFNQDGSINSFYPSFKTNDNISEELKVSDLTEEDSITIEIARKEADSINLKSVVFGLTKENIIYLGIENPISIACVGIPNKLLFVRSSKGSKIIHLEGTEYLIRINSDADDFPRTCNIEVFYIDENKKKVKIGYKNFRVREFPKPKISLGPIEENGFVTKGQLANVNFLFLILPDITACGVRFFPTSYKIAFSIDNKPDEIFEEDSENLSDRVKNRLRNCKKGERIAVYDVKGKGPAGSFKLVDRLVLMVE